LVVSIADIAKRALDYSRSRKRSFYHDESRMRPLVADFGQRTAVDITPHEIEAWLDSHAKWSPAKKNRYLMMMKLAYKLAENAQIISYNPARLVSQRKEDNGRIRYLSDVEETALRKVIVEFYAGHLPGFEVALMTGMRRGEQFSLTWEQVDLSTGTIRLDQTKNGTRRLVRLNSRALTAMRMLHDQSIGTGRVFPVKIPRWFEDALKQAGIMDFTWHSLRQTFASRLVMAGVDLRTVQELGGWKSINMVMRYAHLSPGHKAAALEKLCEPTATRTATGPEGAENGRMVSIN